VSLGSNCPAGSSSGGGFRCGDSWYPFVDDNNTLETDSTTTVPYAVASSWGQETGSQYVMEMDDPVRYGYNGSIVNFGNANLWTQTVSGCTYFYPSGDVC
jgi:hypothetical protein